MGAECKSSAVHNFDSGYPQEQTLNYGNGNLHMVMRSRE